MAWCARRVTLALDGAVAAGAFFRDQVNAGVGAIEIRVYRRPFLPQPDLGKTVLVERILEKVCLDQPFKEAALVGF